jgi:hypothetical protein
VLGQRQHRLAALDHQQGEIERFLKPRDGIADCRLASIQYGGCLRKAALVDHGRQYRPLLQGCFRQIHVLSNFSINYP